MIEDVLKPIVARERASKRKVERRLAAVLGLDIKGYSILISKDEANTHSRVGTALARAVSLIRRFNGRVFSFSGDGLMAEFPSAIDALKCGLRIQIEAWRRNAKGADGEQIEYRIGVNSGDIVAQSGRVGGDVVNIAARLEQIADPGSIFISRMVYEQTQGIIAVPYEYLGETKLKNIRRPLIVYRIPRDACRPAGTLPRASNPLQLAAIADSRPSLAVLPFRTLQQDQSDAYFAEGMVDDIIRALGGLKDLLVIARTSTLSYARTQVDPVRVGRELSVGYTLHGSVRRAGSRLRIAAELNETAAGRVIWADRFDGSAEEIFDLQDRIAIQVTAMIAPHLRDRELRRAMRTRSESMTAYDLVLQALDLFHRNQIGPYLRAGELLQEAIRHDDGFAPAHSYLALWHMLGIAQGWSTDVTASVESAACAAAIAIERDGNDAQALAWYGHTRSFLLRDYTGACYFLDRALEAGPNCAIAWSLSSLTRGYLEDGATAIEHGQHGLRLSPQGPDLYMQEHFLSQAYYVNGDNEEALYWARRSHSHNASHTSNLRVLIASLVQLGMTKEASDLARNMLALDPGFTLSSYANRTPLAGSARDRLVASLRQVGLPE